MTAYPFPSIDPRAQAKVAFGHILPSQSPATSDCLRFVFRSLRARRADGGLRHSPTVPAIRLAFPLLEVDLLCCGCDRPSLFDPNRTPLHRHWSRDRRDQCHFPILDRIRPSLYGRQRGTVDLDRGNATFLLAT